MLYISKYLFAFLLLFRGVPFGGTFYETLSLYANEVGIKINEYGLPDGYARSSMSQIDWFNQEEPFGRTSDSQAREKIAGYDCWVHLFFRNHDLTDSSMENTVFTKGFYEIRKSFTCKQQYVSPSKLIMLYNEATDINTDLINKLTALYGKPSKSNTYTVETIDACADHLASCVVWDDFSNNAEIRLETHIGGTYAGSGSICLTVLIIYESRDEQAILDEMVKQGTLDTSNSSNNSGKPNSNGL